MKHEQCYSCWS